MQKMRKGKERRESCKDERKGKSWESLVAEIEERESESEKDGRCFPFLKTDSFDLEGEGSRGWGMVNGE